MKKLIVRFSVALAGSLAFVVIGSTGMASASVNIVVSGPGAKVVANGASGNISVNASGPGSVVIVNSSHGCGCKEKCERRCCNVLRYHNWHWGHRCFCEHW